MGPEGAERYKMSTKAKTRTKLGYVTVMLPPTIAHALFVGLHDALNEVDGAQLLMPRHLDDEQLTQIGEAFEYLEHQLTEQIVGSTTYTPHTIEEQIAIERNIVTQRRLQNFTAEFNTAKRSK
jgi:hypothetical protein